MIDYHPGSYQLTFIFSLTGSVLPRAMAYAVPSGVLAIFLKGFDIEQHFEGVLTTSAAYSGFSFVVGFLLVFRTSQSYARFWDGATKVQQMKSKWVDAFSSLAAFSRNSKRPREDVVRFQQTLLRLFSLMHSLALKNIHCLPGETFDIVDQEGLDDESMAYLERVPVTCRLDVVSQWIEQLIVNSIDGGLLPVPPPILSRVFQEMSNASVNMENAQKIAQTPFPFPYAQMMTVLLLMHWILTPVLMCMWTGHWTYSFIWTFVPVLSFWGINMIAAEIEQPFGDDVNDLPTHELQKELNSTLILLLEEQLGRVPTLKPNAEMDPRKLREKYCEMPEPSQWQGGSRLEELKKHAYKFIEEALHHHRSEAETEPKHQERERMPYDRLRDLDKQVPEDSRVDIVVSEGMGASRAGGKAIFDWTHNSPKLQEAPVSAVLVPTLEATDSKAQQPASTVPTAETKDAISQSPASAKGADAIILEKSPDTAAKSPADPSASASAELQKMMPHLLTSIDELGKLFTRSMTEWHANQQSWMVLLQDQVGALRSNALAQTKWTQAVQDQIIVQTINSHAIQKFTDAIPASIGLDPTKRGSNGLLAVPSSRTDVADAAGSMPALVPSFSPLCRFPSVPDSMSIPLCTQPTLPSVQSLSSFCRELPQHLRPSDDVGASTTDLQPCPELPPEA